MSYTKVGVKEIALRAGVSIGTVDRVLHERGGVSAETKASIEAIVAELGYKPNVLARHLSLNREYILHILLPKADQDSGYWGICLKGIEASKTELAAYGAKVEIDEFDRYDRKGCRKVLDRVVKDPGDGLLIAPVLPEELLAALCRLPSELPYVFFDGTLPEAFPFASIGQDSLKAGRTAGRLMSLLTPGATRILAINAHAEDRHIRNRIEGFRNFFSELAASGVQVPLIEVVDAEGIDDNAKRDSVFERLFSSGPTVGGILVPNASGHLVAEWLEGRSLKKGCALLAWDLVPANEACLRSGSIDCIISQKPFEQGRLGLSLILRKVVGGTPTPGRFDLPIEIWFKENLPA